MTPPPKCIEDITHSKVKVEENSRKATFKNPNATKYQRVKIDGCVITEGPRCDYIVREIGSTTVFVELKGRDVEHACHQLLSTHEHEAVKSLIEKNVGFLVICKKYPRFDTYVARAKQACAKKLGAGFHVVCDSGEFDISRVAAIDGPK
jgi:hypothetical protein